MEAEYCCPEEKAVAEQLISLGQSHLLKDLAKFTKDQRMAFVEQVKSLDKTYPGGIKEYITRAQKLLKDSANNVNPYEGYQPLVPAGQKVNYENLEELENLESTGLKELKDAAFVLVAGGLGERLGYPGIKITIPIELVTSASFMRYYIEYLLALQKKTGIF